MLTSALLLGVSCWALQAGALPISPRRLVSLIFWLDGSDTLERSVLLQLRLPRILFAIATGGALAVSGVCMQAMFRNPLAEPGLIGVSSGAVLGVMISLLLGMTSFFLMGLLGVLGALAASFAAYVLSKRYPGVGGLLLAGIAINAFALSLVSLATTFASESQFRTFSFWSMGSLSRVGWLSVGWLVPWTLLWSWWLCRHWRVLNAMLLGEREAHHLGFDLHRLRKRMVVAMALLVGPLVSVTGGIGFVGLVVPHLIRMVLGADHRFLLGLSWFGGALALLLADTLARMVVLPAELPVGVVTSLIGGPFFLWLLARQGAQHKLQT